MSLIGETVGRIRIVDELGRGGMGELYVGFDSVLQRKVAVKAMRSKYRLDEVSKARFLREARVLSQLDHPNICQIHDFIETDDIDILVLELIQGEGLGQAVANGLEESQKFRIAKNLASALAAAHEKGVVHRDFKPGNIMLTNGGVPKVLDFGLARRVMDDDVSTFSMVGDSGDAALEEGAGTEGIKTRLGTVVGTLGYMSPEQATGENVTAASDVYSLGLVLQHLFTGKRPFDSTVPRMELLLKAARGETAPVEGIDADLIGLIERLKAIEPGVRPTARDVEAQLRWIEGKPGRRLRHLLRVSAFTVLLLMLLVVGYQAIRISREAERANREAQTAEQVSDFLVGLFRVSDPDERAGEKVTVREVLDRGARRAVGELQGEPLVQSKLLTTMGSVYQNLGLYDEAQDLLEEALASRRRSLGDDHLDVADSQCELGAVLRMLGDYLEAEEHYRECVRIRINLLGEDSGPVANGLEEMAWVLMERGDAMAAYKVQQQSLDIRRGLDTEEESRLADSLAGLATILMSVSETTGDRSYLEEGIEVAREALDVSRRHFGLRHSDVTQKTNNLAFLLTRAGQLDEGEAQYRQALAMKIEIFGPEHPVVATTQGNLSTLLCLKGEYAEAEELARAALEIRRSYLATDHWRIAQAESMLGASLVGAGRYEEAEDLLLEGHRILQEKLGEDSVHTADAMDRIVTLYEAWGKPGDAESYRQPLGEDAGEEAVGER